MFTESKKNSFPNSNFNFIIHLPQIVLFIDTCIYFIERLFAIGPQFYATPWLSPPPPPLVLIPETCHGTPSLYATVICQSGLHPQSRLQSHLSTQSSAETCKNSPPGLVRDIRHDLYSLSRSSPL